MLQFELVTLDGTKLSEEVYEVRLPTPQGEIGVFTNHAPLVSVAVPGVITVKRGAGDPPAKFELFATNGGVIEVVEGKVRVLVDEADRSDEINEQEVQKAYERAQAMRAEAKDQVSLDKAQSLIDRHAVRLQVAGLRRRHPRR
ncbi:MAG: F-type H+-transporting ATPase subunit epsilon [Patescibacteria group bacterium]|nr:F-type H+-transporting ATPase subunit epsilon [Patescibacteria group bacterium]